MYFGHLLCRFSDKGAPDVFDRRRWRDEYRQVAFAGVIRDKSKPMLGPGLLRNLFDKWIETERVFFYLVP